MADFAQTFTLSMITDYRLPMVVGGKFFYLKDSRPELSWGYEESMVHWEESYNTEGAALADIVAGLEAWLLGWVGEMAARGATSLLGVALMLSAAEVSISTASLALQKSMASFRGGQFTVSLSRANNPDEMLLTLTYKDGIEYVYYFKPWNKEIQYLFLV